MKALSVGMYVRTEKGIAKIKKIFPDGSEPYFEAKYETDTYLEIYYDSQYVSEDDVLKANYNIINILEERDYVNGYPICEIIEYKDGTKAIIIDDGEKTFIQKNENIKSVITHEQMEQMAYKVEEWKWKLK